LKKIRKRISWSKPIIPNAHSNARFPSELEKSWRAFCAFRRIDFAATCFEPFMSLEPPSDYQLSKLLGENQRTNIWLADQLSVRRNVVLEQLRDLSSEHREDFLASVRVKASIDHPLIASVYEAINDDDHCMFTREWLPGENLSSLKERGFTLKPAQLAHVIKRVAEACMHLEERSIPTDEMTLSHIYLNEQNVLRLSNLAKSGIRDDQTSARDMAALGSHLLPLMEPGESGYTRVQTLLHWMTGKDPQHIMQWKDIRHYADQIEQQLAAPVVPMHTSRQPQLTVVKKKNPLPIILGVIGAIIAAVILLVLSQKQKQEKTTVTQLDGPILIPEGMHPGPDGNENKIRKFWLSSHEVTIGEYREFLETLKFLESDQRKIFDHESQPPTKLSHETESWTEILAAAEKRGIWKNRTLTMNSPVFGVDWWDAHAYCEWKRARLPTQEEWYAAMRMQTLNPLSLKPTAWGDVVSLDKNGAGFFGMAGGVSEWTRKPASNPSNPLGARQWVIIGASFAKTANGAQAREWTNNRDLRRDDLGFRIAYDHLPD
jgi:formylglycine-generating enzyme required for sulfatase activity